MAQTLKLIELFPPKKKKKLLVLMEKTDVNKVLKLKNRVVVR